MTVDPQAGYASRGDERRAARLVLEAQDRNLSTARGVVALIGAIALFSINSTRPAAVALFAVAVLVFVVLIILHEKVSQKLRRATQRVEFYDKSLARTRGEWIGRGETGARFLDPAHPNAIDLDLFGRASLFERLCVARTHAGQQQLANWLLGASPIDELRQRQEALTDLGPRLDLREDLSVLGAEARRAVDSAALLKWATAPPVEVPTSLRIVAALSSAAVFVSLLGWALDWWDGVPFRLAFVAVVVCTWRARSFVHAVLDGIGRPVQDLETLSELFARLVDEKFESKRLSTLHQTLIAAGEPPSRPIGQLKRWLEIHESKSNVFFGVLSFFLVWDLQFAAAVENWRRRFGAPVARWIATLGEFEGLVSLATYSYENPADPFPTFDEAGPGFHGVGIAHPLLKSERAIRNDVSLDARMQMLVITGSNMSGKSTLLRTVGMNVVLALAGAPVRATSLRLSLLAIGASIRVTDSLQDGESRFYAEIKRVRQILDLAQGATPCLFLMDEIFDGTNSAERRIGAEAVVRSLIERRAIGLVTSHDLALAEIAVSLNPRATNVHFEDHLEGDRMAFDYRIKPGPVSRGNALGLMRAVGLDV